MILLFGEQATQSKNTGVKNINNPVENSGILAMNGETALKFLNASEYDDFIASNPVAINYAAYSQWSDTQDNSSGFSYVSVGDECLGSDYTAATFGGEACASFGGGECSFSGGGSFSSVC
ncbi:hypothetical protein IJ579_03455 [bacterium]|nr:hypothetical protein [bacterium]